MYTCGPPASTFQRLGLLDQRLSLLSQRLECVIVLCDTLPEYLTQSKVCKPSNGLQGPRSWHLQELLWPHILLPASPNLLRGMDIPNVSWRSQVLFHLETLAFAIHFDFMLALLVFSLYLPHSFSPLLGHHLNQAFPSHPIYAWSLPPTPLFPFLFYHYLCTCYLWHLMHFTYSLCLLSPFGPKFPEEEFRTHFLHQRIPMSRRVSSIL